MGRVGRNAAACGTRFEVSGWRVGWSGVHVASVRIARSAYAPAGMRSFVATLEIPEDAKQRLMDLTPGSYIGAAAQLARAI